MQITDRRWQNADGFRLKASSVVGSLALVFGSVLVLFLIGAEEQQFSFVASSHASGDKKSNTFLELGLGPHLLIDDYLIAGSTNVSRVVNQPQRELSGPVVSSEPGLQASQPFVTVLYDEGTGRFRMWYNTWRTAEEEATSYYGPALSYLESSDGITWAGPLQRLDLAHSVSASILDEGAGYVPVGERYKQIYSYVQKPGFEDEDWLKSRIAFSADGVNWNWYAGVDTLFPGHGGSSNENWGDILNSYYDPIRGQYGLFFRYYEPYTWENAEGVTQTDTIRRTGFMTSSDYIHWTAPEVIFSPDSQDEGITEFYGGPASVQRRGDLLIGMLKVLRDDVVVSGAPAGAYGMGYTVLAWSRDG